MAWPIHKFAALPGSEQPSGNARFLSACVLYACAERLQSAGFWHPCKGNCRCCVSQPLDHGELLSLQRIGIGDDRFVKLGLRQEGGVIGEHDRTTQSPLPVHISARHEDLPNLIDGMLAFN